MMSEVCCGQAFLFGLLLGVFIGSKISLLFWLLRRRLKTTFSPAE